jgi:hypothetical protein
MKAEAAGAVLTRQLPSLEFDTKLADRLADQCRQLVKALLDAAIELPLRAHQLNDDRVEIVGNGTSAAMANDRCEPVEVGRLARMLEATLKRV